MTRHFIIFAPSFNENSGGSIVLHRLCDLLNRGGQRALLWPSRQVLFNPWRPLYSWNRQRLLKRWYRKYGDYRTHEGFLTPFATPADLEGAIVVYPEVTDGNPLRARRVVRWLLHRPGFHTGRINFGAHDRFFFYQQAFDDARYNSEPDNLLKTVFLRDDIYRQTHFGERQGCCHILRKGADRPMQHDVADSILIDGLSHREAAAVFNRVRTCISYDLYTMYSQFAALCGCDSIVLPEAGMTPESWYPDPRDRYGVSLGWEGVEEARRTAPLLHAHLKQQEADANASVAAFVRKCEGYFGG